MGASRYKSNQRGALRTATSMKASETFNPAQSFLAATQSRFLMQVKLRIVLRMNSQVFHLWLRWLFSWTKCKNETYFNNV